MGSNSVSRRKTEEMEQENIKVHNYKENLPWTDVNSKPADQKGTTYHRENIS